MDKVAVISFLLHVLDQSWQTTLGPMAVYGVTWVVNKWKGYVPRELQIPLAGIFAAVASALGGGDPAVGLATGSLMQAAFSTDPKAVKASAKE